MSISFNNSPQGVIRIIPIGGLGEVGKNMMYIEYEKDDYLSSIVIDTGLMFPENDMLGIDYIIPDYSAIIDRMRDSLAAILITHGHEDHIGAISHVLGDFDVPIYATSLTIALIERKLLESGMTHKLHLLNRINPGDNIAKGPFSIDTFHVCHSIPDSIGLGIHTPKGLIVHTGDFKIDYTPVDNWPPDFNKLADFARKGVMVLLSDSTNALSEGWTPTEMVIEPEFEEIFEKAQGRIIIGTFASLISRVQQVVNVTQKFKRKLVINGRSMEEYSELARELGYLNIPNSLLVTLEEAEKIPDEKIVIMTTGTQGELRGGLSRLAYDRHRSIEVKPTDTYIFSSHPIPGNEELVNRTINKLIQHKAEVIYDPVEAVHVSGHAHRDELTFMLKLLKPKFFMPVHGELRHLTMHKRIAMDTGIPEENIAVVENGTVITFDGESMEIGERVPGGYIYVDGSVVGDVGPVVMRDREMLGQSGFVIVILTVTRETRSIVGEPEFISRGFVYLREAHDLIEGALVAIREVVTLRNRESIRDIRSGIQRKLEKYFYNETKRRPMVFAFIYEI